MPARSLPTLLVAAALALAAPSLAAPASPAATPDSLVVLETTHGAITIALEDSAAPRTCANFRRLAAVGFYDSTCFHRLVPGFVIQGGDPNSRDENPFDDGRGGPGYVVPAEIGRPHVRGAVAMARMPDAVNPQKDSSGSQFYVCLADRPDLDRGGYTVFGRVVRGMDVVDRIAALAETPGIARTPAGANPGRLALVRRARLEPVSAAPRAAAAKPAR